jgi:hypothetical protein
MAGEASAMQVIDGQVGRGERMTAGLSEETSAAPLTTGKP